MLDTDVPHRVQGVSSSCHRGSLQAGSATSGHGLSQPEREPQTVDHQVEAADHQQDLGSDDDDLTAGKSHAHGAEQGLHRPQDRDEQDRRDQRASSLAG